MPASRSKRRASDAAQTPAKTKKARADTPFRRSTRLRKRSNPEELVSLDMDTPHRKRTQQSQGKSESKLDNESPLKSLRREMIGAASPIAEAVEEAGTRDEKQDVNFASHRRRQTLFLPSDNKVSPSSKRRQSVLDMQLEDVEIAEEEREVLIPTLAALTPSKSLRALMNAKEEITVDDMDDLNTTDEFANLFTHQEEPTDVGNKPTDADNGSVLAVPNEDHIAASTEQTRTKTEVSADLTTDLTTDTLHLTYWIQVFCRVLLRNPQEFLTIFALILTANFISVAAAVLGMSVIPSASSASTTPTPFLKTSLPGSLIFSVIAACFLSAALAASHQIKCNEVFDRGCFWRLACGFGSTIAALALCLAGYGTRTVVWQYSVYVCAFSFVCCDLGSQAHSHTLPLAVEAMLLIIGGTCAWLMYTCNDEGRASTQEVCGHDTSVVMLSFVWVVVRTQAPTLQWLTCVVGLVLLCIISFSNDVASYDMVLGFSLWGFSLVNNMVTFTPKPVIKLPLGIRDKCANVLS